MALEPGALARAWQADRQAPRRPSAVWSVWAAGCAAGSAASTGVSASAPSPVDHPVPVSKEVAALVEGDHPVPDVHDGGCGRAALLLGPPSRLLPRPRAVDSCSLGLVGLGFEFGLVGLSVGLELRRVGKSSVAKVQGFLAGFWRFACGLRRLLRSRVHLRMLHL